MPSSLRGPQALADWIELDYFRRPRLLRRLRLGVVVGALALSGGFVTWLVAAGQRTALQAGPVSDAHAMFNNDCAQCHVGTFRPLARLVQFDSNIHSVPDQACRKCHSGEAHHATAVGERHCAGCHREHRGQHTLVRVTDRHCTDCHADLKRNDGRTPEYDPHVTAFAPGRHPDFRLWRDGEPKDPGTIRFNHALHLNPEGVLEIDRAQVQKQAAQALEQGAAPFALDIGKDLKRRRKLECQDCHQPDSAGRLMQPITFDRHCKSCHPVQVQLIGGWTDPALLERARTFSASPLPHPAPTETPEVVRGVLRDRLARFISDRGNKAFLSAVEDPQPERAIPGAPRPPSLTEKQFAWVNDQQERVERFLFNGEGGCGYCHQEKAGAHKGPGSLPEYLPSGIRQRWSEHALFSHHSHRMLDCAGCHGAADSAKTSDVLLPRINECMKCHGSQERKARSDCVECHLYHDPVKRLDFRGTLTIDRMTGK